MVGSTRDLLARIRRDRQRHNIQQAQRMRQGRRVIPDLGRDGRASDSRQQLSSQRRGLGRQLRKITTVSRNNLFRVLQGHVRDVARSRHTRQRLRRNGGRASARRKVIRAGVLMPRRRQGRREHVQRRRGKRHRRRSRVTTQVIRAKRQVTYRHTRRRKRRRNSRHRRRQIRRMLQRTFLMTRRHRVIIRAPTLKLYKAELQARQTSRRPSRQQGRSRDRRAFRGVSSCTLPR